MKSDSETRYLLRFDDLCPTMDRGKWQRYVSMLERYEIQPILAVIPENADPAFEVEAADPRFWAQMRELEMTGATIGLHGYRHVCRARGRGLIPLHRLTEFAGAAEEDQRRWIRDGLEVLRRHGLSPRIWVAPRHGFDRTTLGVLKDAGIDVISDGFAVGPFGWYGMVWFPQQLWGPREKTSGVWTICVHAQTASDATVAELEMFLERYASRFTSVERVLAEGSVRPRSPGDRLFHFRMMLRIRLVGIKRRLLLRMGKA
ncbi:DUF2334 domain-containing protein [Acidicapsa ligni]|uniref:DUF2334 domain-containing protein n=1 Tax=Acidicapsa ligni TaxID=542300 RepID=UPI0021DF98EC|nr:DUF2334 domain-containing protein [Acidicapsa ligni]